MTAPDRRESFPYNRKQLEEALLHLLENRNNTVAIYYDPAFVEIDEDSLSTEAQKRNAERSLKRREWAARIRSVYHTVQFNGDKPSLNIRRSQYGECIIGLKR